MKPLIALFVASILFLPFGPARAGVYADDLSKCLISSSSDADKALLMKWIFSAIALNSEVSQFVDMPAAVRTEINEDAADLYMRLLTESCDTQTHDAFKYEGQAAIHSAFQLLGQIASQGIFSDPAVVAGMTEMTNFIDEKKLTAVLQGSKD